jgi:hypothetical protein
VLAVDGLELWISGAFAMGAGDRGERVQGQRATGVAGGAARA